MNNPRLGSGTHHMRRPVVAAPLAPSCEIDDLGSRVGGGGEEENGGLHVVGCCSPALAAASEKLRPA